MSLAAAVFATVLLASRLPSALHVCVQVCMSQCNLSLTD